MRALYVPVLGQRQKQIALPLRCKVRNTGRDAPTIQAMARFAFALGDGLSRLGIPVDGVSAGVVAVGAAFPADGLAGSLFSEQPTSATDKTALSKKYLIAGLQVNGSPTIEVFPDGRFAPFELITF